MLGTGIASAFMVVYFSSGAFISSWFVHDRAVVTLAAQLLVVAAVFQLFDGGQVIAAALLRGLKDVRVPTLITLIAYWIISIGGGYVIGIRAGFGAVGIWASLAAGLAFAAIFLVLRFRLLTRTTIAGP
jgi:MATE family multidrug resistance protein